MHRSFAIFAILVTLIGGILAAPASGQTADEQWKGLVMQALYAASANNFSQAEQIFLRAIHEAERFGADDARVGTTLNSLGLIYRAEKKYADAESVYRRALAILEKAYGDGSIDVANVNFNIGTVMFDQNHQPSALPYAQKSMASYSTLLGGASLKTAAALCMVGDAYRTMKSYNEAEGPLRRCADIREQDGGLQNPDLADAQHSLALVLQGQGKLTQAESRYKLAEKIDESTLGITSAPLAQTLEDHAILLRQMGRDKEAEKLVTMASAIRRTQKK
jgi:tetratricopeptide (TPR) repeat protein